ncbi:MAG: porin family protein [Bacteroidota bacterium]
MKKSIITCSCFILALTLKGQSWTVGVQGGPSWSKMNAKNAKNEDSRFGYHIGLWVNKHVTRKISLQGGFNYMAVGATNEGLTTQNSNSIVLLEYNLNYISVPLNVNYHPHELISIGAGFYTGFLAGFKLRREGSRSNTFNTPEKNNLKSQDFGYQINFWVNYSVLSFGVQYRNSFSELPNSRLAEALIADAQNSAIQVAIRYTLYKKNPK